MSEMVSIPWLVFGIAAIISACMNLAFFRKPRKSKIFRFLSLSFTALTVCGFYWQETSYVLEGDWSALMDIMPTVSKLLWVCVFASILINGITLFSSDSNG